MLGTGRENSVTAKLFPAIVKIAQDYGEITVATADEHATRLTWEPSPAKVPWPQLVEKSDAILIVSPEYNRSFPGELKNVLDQGYKEYKDKVVGIIGMSDGPFGGARMSEAIKPTLTTLGLIVTQRAALFSFADKIAEKPEQEQIEEIKDRIIPILEEMVRIYRRFSN